MELRQQGVIGTPLTEWQSQNQTKRDNLVGRILISVEAGYRVHLLVRNGKFRNGKAAPFIYCGGTRSFAQKFGSSTLRNNAKNNFCAA
jgi:hypothetical protein